MDAAGEAQRQHPLARIRQSPGRHERGLVGNLNPGLREPGGTGVRQLGIGRQAALGGSGSCHGVAPIDEPARRVTVNTRLGGGDCGAAQLCRAVPGDQQDLPSARGTLV